MKSVTAKLVLKPTQRNHRFNTYRLIGSSLFVLFLFSTAWGQENRAPIDTPREPVASGPLVTATATAKRVRFVSPGAVVQLRLEVYNETGQKLFDTELRDGNVLDWHLQDGTGERLPAGSYACVLTTQSLSGRLSQRVGLVTVNDTKTAIEAAGSTELSLAQQQTIGAVEGIGAFAVLQDSEAEAITTITHDGTNGQMARTRGALSFRVGDFFAGKDKEQMRLTEEGNLGLGTSKPEVKLDVAGMIRAREGLMFSDGSTLKVNEKGVLTRTTADGASTSADGLTAKAVTATTQNKIAKFTDNLGTVGDSAITESGSGFIGIGTATPGALLDVSNNTNHLKYSPTTATLTLTGPASSLTANPGLRLDFNSDPDSGLSYLAYAHDNISMAFDAHWNGASWVSSHPGANFAIYKTANQLAIGFNAGTAKGSTFPAFNTTTGVIFSNTGRMGIGGAPGNAKLHVNGNVGIGTTNPATKLDVVGDINTSTQYRIGGNRVFSIAGLSSTFAGLGAGTSNNTGTSNSFFGRNTGSTNTSGSGNSFFGANAGKNSTASFNSFFGATAGGANTTGGGNSFFGYQAGRNNTEGFKNSFFGTDAGFTNTTGCCNAFFGMNAGFTNSTGGSNSFFGDEAGFTNSTGDSNSFFGTGTGYANTTGESNSFFGATAGAANTTGTDNSFFGRNTGLANSDGSSNSFFGVNAGFENKASFNSFFGNDAGKDNTTGKRNSFYGHVAGHNNTEGENNCFFGDEAGGDNETGDSNSFFGVDAGGANTTGEHNIAIGKGAGIFLQSGSNNIYLAHRGGLPDESNTIRIGTQATQTTTFIAGISGATSASGVSVLVNSSGQLGTLTSSRRYKQDIRDMGKNSARLMQLRPVSFLYRPEYVDGDRTLQYGLIAEEVAKVYPELVVYAADGKPQTVRYHLLNTMLLNEMQKQQKRIQSQEHQLQAQTQRITNQAQQLKTQTQQMTRQAQQISSLESRLLRLETGASRRQRARRR